MAKIIEFPTRPTQGAGDRQHRVSFTLKPHLHEAVEIYHQTWFAPYPASYYKSLLYNELIEKALLLCLIEHQTATIWAQICRFFDEHPDVQGLIEQNFRTPEMRHAFWRGSEKDENGTRRVT